MEIDLRWPLLLFCNCILVLLLRLLNDTLGIYGMTLFLPALFLLLPALLMRLRWALLLVAITALMQAAYAPESAMLYLPLYALGVTALYANRIALRRANTSQLILVALLANTLLWLIATLLFGQSWLTDGSYWLRSGSDLLLSSVLLAPVGLWFLAAERGLLARFASNDFPEEQ